MQQKLESMAVGAYAVFEIGGQRLEFRCMGPDQLAMGGETLSAAAWAQRYATMSPIFHGITSPC